MTRARKNQGFTLVELMITLLILGAVAAVLVPHRFGSRRDANEAGAEKVLQAVLKAERVLKAPRRDLTALTGPGLPPLGVKGGYRFGAIEIGQDGFAFYAVPEVYGVTGRRTFILDAEGRIYAKDTGNAFPPGAWPASDPTAEGWTLLTLSAS